MYSRIFNLFSKKILRGEYVWGILAQIDLAVTITIFDFLKNFVGSISPKITQKTKNDTFGRYRFGK